VGGSARGIDKERRVEEIGQLIAGLEHFVRDYGVFAVLVIVTLEALGAPLPGETLLIFASVLAGRGEMSLPALLIFAWAGSVLGDNIGYAIGRTVGRATISRYGAKIGLNNSRFNKVEEVFLRYGSMAVVFARFFSILRQLNGIVAGTLGMNWLRFLLCNAVGGALWVTVWVFATIYFTEHISVVARLAHHTKVDAIVVAAIALIFVLALLLRRVRRNGWTLRL
jgi:membrane protein DedA with SNARE-associated domain